MKWNELKKQALKHGFQFVRHGKEHDEYYNPETGVTVQLERHGSQEYARAWPPDLKSKSDFNNKGDVAAPHPLVFINR